MCGGVAATLCQTALARAQIPSPPASPRADAAIAAAIDALAALETVHGGRLGVAVVDAGSMRRFGHRADERFAMCSTHKVLTAAAVLDEVDRGEFSLDRRVSYSQADLLDYAPSTKQHVDAGFMTVGALCAACVEFSDNTAANLLLGLLGGPPGWIRYARSLGDHVSRLDRTEPALNTAIPGDERDTTTPAAMVRNLYSVLQGTGLRHSSRVQLETWMLDGHITDSLLRAGMPAGWRVADKSGAGDHGTRNDIGMILRPAGAPVFAAVYYTEAMEPPASRDEVIAQAGRIIVKTLQP